jgi:hypothetical protein
MSQQSQAFETISQSCDHTNRKRKVNQPLIKKDGLKLHVQQHQHKSKEMSTGWAANLTK